jgi:glycosyltransferase involved in cell wall biosynthesis
LRLVSDIRLQRYSAIYVIGLRASLWLRLFRPWLRAAKLVQGVRWNPNTNSRLDRAFLFVERFLGFLIDAYICNSVNAARTLEQRVGICSDKIAVVYNGLDKLPLIRAAYGARPTSVVVLANLNPRKGHVEFLDVVAKVLEQIPEAHFVFVGRDDMNGRLAQEIGQLELGNAVALTGHQSDVEPWLSAARLMVLPSLWGEGCPTSILEGYAYGLPVVAYAIDGVPELIDDGVDGLLVSPTRSDDLVKAIVHVLSDPVRAEKMGAAGREKVSKRFTLVRCCDDHTAAMHKLMT